MLILKNYEAQFVLSAEDSLEKGTQTVVIEHLTITTILEYTKHEKLLMFGLLVSKIEEKHL